MTITSQMVYRRKKVKSSKNKKIFFKQNIQYQGNPSLQGTFPYKYSEGSNTEHLNTIQKQNYHLRNKMATGQLFQFLNAYIFPD